MSLTSYCILFSYVYTYVFIYFHFLYDFLCILAWLVFHNAENAGRMNFICESLFDVAKENQVLSLQWE